MNMQLFTTWYAKYWLLALCCVILLVVPLFHGPGIGTEPFLFNRLAEDVGWWDDLSFGGRFAAYAWGTPLVMSPAPALLLSALPILLGILSFLTLGLILDKLTSNVMLKHVAQLLFIISPTFIYTFSFANSLFVPFFLSLAAFHLFLTERYRWLVLPIVMVLPLFSLVMTFTLLLVLFCYSFFWKKDCRWLALGSMVLALLAGGLYYGYILFNTGLPLPFALEEPAQFAIFSKLFYDFGAAFGIGLFVTLLAGFGIFLAWDKKYSNLFFFFSIFGLLTLSFFRTEALLTLNVFLVVFAARGVLALLNLRWTSNDFRILALIAVCSGLLFSGVSQISTLNSSDPSDAIIEGLVFLGEQDEGVVFSHYSRGVWLNAAGHKNVMDENYLFVSDAEERARDSATLFNTRDLGEAEMIFQKYDISYIWIDEKMKETLWTGESDGLLFVLQYTKNFKKVYDKEGVEIWEIPQK